MSGHEHLDAVDTSLVRLRRIWTGTPQWTDAEGRPVEMSSVLVVEGCARLGATGRQVTVGALADFADVTASTASRLVDRAVTAGLVARLPASRDRRQAALALTAAGQALRDRAVSFRLAWLRSTLAGWSEQDVAALADTLTRFAEAVAVAGGPGRAPGRPT